MTDPIEPLEALRAIAAGEAHNPQQYASRVLESYGHNEFFVQGRGQIVAEMALPGEDNHSVSVKWARPEVITIQHFPADERVTEVFTVWLADEGAPAGSNLKVMERVLGLAFGAEDVWVREVTV